MIFYERNLKLLSEKQPELYKKMQTPESNLTFSGINIGFMKNDKDIIDNIVINIGDKNFIDSKGADAELWVKSVNPEAHTIIVIGLGLGYHVEKLIDTYPGKNIIVIEPDKRVFGHSLNIKCFEKIICNTQLWIDEEINLVKAKIHELVTHPLARGIELLPYYLLYEDYCRELLMGCQKMLNDWAVMVNTKRCLVDKWYINRVENAKKPSANAKELIGKFKDIPGILVGAGPSLQGQIETLKKLQGKAVIIAASTAIEILTSNNIEPTFMVAIDQDPITSGGLHENLQVDVPLIFDGQVAQNSLNFKGKKFQMLLNVNRYTNMVVPDLPLFESGPSVGNVVIDILHKFGCSPILICGFDMSYTDGKLYCDGTQFNQDMSQVQSMRMVNNKGEICTTEPSFLSMKHWFEEYAKRVKPNIYNCTERGLVIEGIENKSFNDFTFDKKHDLKKIIDDCYKDFIDVESIKKVNIEIAEDLNKMKELLINSKQLVPLNNFKSWPLVDEFSSTIIYLEEIRCEEKIKKGIEKEQAIKEFQDKRYNIILSNIDKLIEILK